MSANMDDKMSANMDDKMSANLDDAREWVRRAAKNLAHAEQPLGGDDVPEVECYYAQQAAEMAVKAVYVSLEIPFEYTHSIERLLRGLERKGVSIPGEVDAASGLGGYATETHYLAGSPEPLTEEDRVEAARAARAVLEWAKAEIARAAD